MDRSGATAVEFAMLAGPLFLLIFAILELGIVFLLGATLDNATMGAARTIRTGTSKAATAVAFRDEICNRLGWLQTQCQTNLSVDVRTFQSFGAINDTSAPSPVTNGNFNQGGLTYTPSEAGDIVLVRTFYRWKLLTPYLSGGLKRLSDGSTVLTSATTFRNEPY